VQSSNYIERPALERRCTPLELLTEVAVSGYKTVHDKAGPCKIEPRKPQIPFRR